MGNYTRSTNNPLGDSLEVAVHGTLNVVPSSNWTGIVRVYFLEDNETFGKALRLILNFGNVEVVGDGAQDLMVGKTQKEPVSYIAQRIVAEGPDVFICDLRLGGIGGLDVCAAVKKRAPAIKILLLSGYISRRDILDLVRIGVDGFIAKGCSNAHILEALNSINRGEVVMGGFQTAVNASAER